MKTLVGNNSGLLYRLIPTENTVTILDDIEHTINIIGVHTLLGVTNDLVEQRGYKVIVIANNSYMQQRGEAKLVFKEKVIEKTLGYEPDAMSIFEGLCRKGYSSPFTAFMTTQKAMVVIDPSYPSYKEDKGLLVELHNIRILKFVLVHFSKIYEVCNAFLKDESKDAADSFLLSLWACTAGVAIGYKKDRLTYEDRLQFVQYVELSSIGWEFGDDERKTDGLFDETQEDEEQEKQKEEKQYEYTNRRITYIFKKLVEVHNFPVTVSSQILDSVTAGVSLDKEGLKAVQEGYENQVQRNDINPTHALLQKFMHPRQDMSNREMAGAVMQLTQYVEDGKSRDNMAYVNSATYLQHFYPLTPFSKEGMQKKIRCGIDKMYKSIDTPNLLDKLNLDVVETAIPKESRRVAEYEREEMNKITKADLDADIKEVHRQFIEDLPTLASRLTIQYGDTKTPDFLSYPILKHIPKKDTTKRVNNIQPKEVTALYQILNGRFLQQIPYPEVYDVELPFVRNSEQTLAQKNDNKTTYADILVEDHPEDVIKKIQK